MGSRIRCTRRPFAPSFNQQLESLETRRLLSVAGPIKVEFNDRPVPDLAPQYVDPKTGINPPHMSGRVADPADIIWVNRGTTDSFDAVFGTFAATARGVVDAVIARYEQMIGSFDYSLAGQSYSLTLSMNAGGGFGASAQLNTQLSGKPKSGFISMLRGNNAASTNTDHGWFLDPTPTDSSEFTGNIQNAFEPTASSGAAFNKGDFYAVVASEMTHCMGLFGSSLAAWSARVTNTGIHDGVTGVGNYWVFQGPSVKHLGTSDNAGQQDFGSLIHSAEGASNINFGGLFWRGAEDQGNAFFDFSQRSMINNAFALMFKDAYNYQTVNPDKFGTAYSTYNETADTLLVRGGDFASGHTNSNDNISITRSGNILTVSVDAGSDVGGTGATPGDENLPAFVTTYDLTTQPITSIQLNPGAGNDAVTIGTNLGMPVTVTDTLGTDSITYVGTSSSETINVTSTSMSSGATTVTASGFETVSVDAGGGTDVINVTDSAAGVPINVIDSTGADALNVNTDNVGTAEARFNSSMNLGVVTVGAGGLANMVANGGRVLSMTAVAVAPTGRVDLNDNDAIVDYTGATAIGAVQALLNSGRSGGAWANEGITSTNAKNNALHNTTVGAIEATDYKSVFGAGATFDGVTIDNSAVLIKYTYYGDTDFNGQVNLDDYSRTDAGFNNNRSGWFNGDFDGNGQVNFDDYSLIDLAFSTQGAILTGFRPGAGDIGGLGRLGGRGLRSL